MSGKGPGAGFDFQSRLIGVVDAHILARRPLGWVQLATRDIPVAVTAEGGGSGDDLRVELTGGANVYECQAKRGLSADTRLDDAIDLFARGMPADPAELGILVVDPSSAGTIRLALRDGLDAWRQGTRPELKGPLERVMKRLSAASAEATADRLFVQTLDVEQDASAGAQNAVLLLERILDDPDQAGAAWAVLVADGLRMCREGGRRDYDALVARLGQENIHLAGSGQGVTQALTHVEAQLDRRAARAEEQHEEIMAMLAGRFATPPDASGSEVDRFTVQLDTAKELVAGGRASASLEMLRAISGAVTEASEPTRIRYHNLVAGALLTLERAAEGKEELQKVLKLAPDDVTALANLAQAESIAGNLDEAVRHADRVLELDPLCEAAWIVLVQGRPGTTVPAELADQADVLTATGFADTLAHRWESAIAHLRAAMEAGYDEERALYLAQAVYGRALYEPDDSRDAELLAEARALLDRVVGSLAGRADSLLLERALLTRGQLEFLRGNDTVGNADFNEAAKLFPSSPHATHLLATSYLRRREPERALFALERVPAERWNAALHMARARALVEVGRKSEVEQEIARARASLPRNRRTRSDIILGLAEVSFDADLLDVAEHLLGDAELEPSWLVDLELARLAARRGDDVGAAERYEAALASAPAHARVHTAGEYAEQLRLRGATSDAVSVLERADATRVPALRPIYARALFDSRQFTRSAMLVEAATAEGGELPVWALQLGTQVALVREDVPSAISYLRELHERFPRNIENGVRLAQVSLWGGDRETAIRVLDRLSDSDALPARQLLQVAGGYIRAGRPAQALPLAYRAMRMEPDAEDIQLAYVQTFMRHNSDAESLEVDTVQPDTAITLTTGRDETLVYFIVSDEPRRAAGELSSGDELAKVFLGKQVGDEMVLRPGAASETVAKVTEVRSKYVYLFQEILLRFPERHPQSAALQSFQIPDDPTADDFKFVAEVVRADADSAAQALAAYRKAGSLPLGMLASLIGGTIRDAYALVANDTTGWLGVDQPDETGTSISAAGSALPVVLTRSALVTVEELGLFRVVEAMCPNLIVPWSLLEELQEERLEMVERARQGHTSLYRDGDAIVPRELPAAYLQGRLSRFDTMVAWVRQRCALAPRPLSSIEPDEDNPRSRRTVLGASSYDSLALADELGAEVYADDLGLRTLLRGRTIHSGFSSFGLVRAAESAGKSSQEEADAWTARMIQLRHASVLMTPRVMVAAIRESDYRIHGRLAPLLDMLRDPSIPPGSIIMFCIETLAEVAVSPDGAPHVGAVAYALFEAGCGGRDARAMLHVIDQLARRRLLVLPAAMDATIAAANRYMRIGVLGESPLYRS